MSQLLLGVGRARQQYIDKVLAIARDNLIGLWLQDEKSGAVSYDLSGKGNDGAYTGVALGQPGVPGMGYSSPLFDGTNDYNDIYSAGLANNNLLSNPGFETAGAAPPTWANWTDVLGDGAIANEIAIIHEGVDAAKITAGANRNTVVVQTVTVVAGQKYRLRFWTRGDGTYAGQYSVYDVDNSEYIVSARTTGVAGATYTAVVKEFTSPAGCTSAQIAMRCPNTDGGIAYFDACEVRSMDGFLGDEGTLLAWAQVSAAGVWEDGVIRYIAALNVDGDNRILLYKSSVNNTVRFYYESANVSLSQETAGLTNIDFACYAMTWSKSGDAVKYYIAGGASGAADTGLGTWVGNLVNTGTIIGAASTVPATVWSGNIGPVALYNTALTPAQILYLSTV